MNLFICTPSYNQLDFLKRCIASVADQIGSHREQRTDDRGRRTDKLISDLRSATSEGGSTISVHHHVQDGGSTDGSREYLAEDLANSNQQSVVRSDLRPLSSDLSPGYTFTCESVPDNGMYDAINRGVELAIEGTRHKAPGTREQKTSNFTPQTSNRPADSVIAWLNCDEQYLPGTLDYVANYFELHPDIDILFGDYLMVDEEGDLLSFRKGSTPRLWYIQASHLNNLSCAMFFRSRVFQALGGFDARYKAVADEDFIVRALKAGFKAGHVSRYFSVFTYTGNNLGGGDVGREEFASLKKETPFLLKLFRIPLNLSRWIEKWIGGTYYQRFPLTYSIYTDGKSERKMLSSKHASWRWPDKEKP